MTVKSMTLSALMAGALLVPAFAFAEDTAKTSPEDGPKKGAEMMHKGFEEADTNKDGSLSLDEFLERHKKKFAEIDTDKNGSLSQDEMKKHGDEKRAEWKERREKFKEGNHGDHPPGDKPAGEAAPEAPKE